MSDMKAYAELRVGADGLVYGVRYLLTPEELAGLQGAGLVGAVSEVDGIEDVGDRLLAQFERQVWTAGGGELQ